MEGHPAVIDHLLNVILQRHPLVQAFVPHHVLVHLIDQLIVLRRVVGRPRCVICLDRRDMHIQGIIVELIDLSLLPLVLKCYLSCIMVFTGLLIEVSAYVVAFGNFNEFILGSSFLGLIGVGLLVSFHFYRL